MKKTKVMIVDDQFVSRKFFEMYIDDSDRYEVSCVVESAAFADAYVLADKIDLVIMDILMNDGSNGLDAAARIKKNCPEIKIIGVTSMPEYSWLDKARSIGIDSFWYKEDPELSFLDVMDRTMAGESVYPAGSPQVMLGMVGSGELTERELEILRIITTGASNSVIAETLGIAESTVKNHIHNILEKTGFSSRTELAIEARTSGIVVNF